VGATFEPSSTFSIIEFVLWLLTKPSLPLQALTSLTLNQGATIQKFLLTQTSITKHNNQHMSALNVELGKVLAKDNQSQKQEQDQTAPNVAKPSKSHIRYLTWWIWDPNNDTKIQIQASSIRHSTTPRFLVAERASDGETLVFPDAQLKFE
jgi:hypothetical protein